MSEEGATVMSEGGGDGNVRGGGATALSEEVPPLQCPRRGGVAVSEGGAAASSLSLPCMLGLSMYICRAGAA